MTTGSARPDPDRLLARLNEESAASRRGRLKIFFGAAPGVGKTYAMLEEARAKRAEGIDLLVGWVETHGRSETQALLSGLPTIPPRLLDYHGHALKEFDLDAAIARRPALILLDELAHTNAPGSRHGKRWQDAAELLAAGIDVYTTVNVQHLESIIDIVAQTTGVTVRETVPDRVFENADEIELVDLPPEDLLKRLREGKVYMPEAAERAIENFFSKGNLIALRELALRRAVERVDAQMRSYKSGQGIETVWPLRERILVCISPSPAAPRVVRAARRMAAGLGAEWIVAYVEKPGKLRDLEEDRRRIAHTLHLAEQLGAEVVTLLGRSVSEEVIAYARSRNVTKIVVGKPRGHWWRYRLLGSVVDELIRNSDEIEIHVTRGEDEEETPAALPPALRPHTPWRQYLWSIPVVLACTGIAASLSTRLAPTNLVMVYLLGVVFVAVRVGRGPSMLAAVLSVLTFDVFFVPPRLRFTVDDTEYLLTFATLLVIGVLISTLAGRLRMQAEASRVREQRTASLYRVSQEFSRAGRLEEVCRIAEHGLGEVLGAEVWILLPDSAGEVRSAPGITSGFPLRAEEKGVAQWVLENGTMAGKGTGTLPAAQALYVPLSASRGTIGVLGLFPVGERESIDPERAHFVEVLASQTALVIERALLVREAQESQLRAETERLRDSLLSSVSHDLRTPLGTITGGASTLADPTAHLSEEARRDLAQSIWEEAERLNRLVGNLLNMSRLEAGEVRLQRDWHPIDEIIGAALTRLERALKNRSISIHIPEDLPMVPLDDVLIEQVIVNLLENAIKFSTEGGPIEIAARVESRELTIEIADRGPGFPPGSEEKIFEKFYRAQEGAAQRGVGLGLAICKGFVEAHDGSIRAENRANGGARFRIALPLGGAPPTVSDKEDAGA